MANSLPGFVQLSNISQSQLITLHQTHVIIGLGEAKICNPLLVQTNVPPNNNVVLGLQKQTGGISVSLHSITTDVVLNVCL